MDSIEWDWSCIHAAFLALLDSVPVNKRKVFAYWIKDQLLLYLQIFEEQNNSSKRKEVLGFELKDATTQTSAVEPTNTTTQTNAGEQTDATTQTNAGEQTDVFKAPDVDETRDSSPPITEVYRRKRGRPRKSAASGSVSKASVVTGRGRRKACPSRLTLRISASRSAVTSRTEADSEQNSIEAETEKTLEQGSLELSVNESAVVEVKQAPIEDESSQTIYNGKLAEADTLFLPEIWKQEEEEGDESKQVPVSEPVSEPEETSVNRRGRKFRKKRVAESVNATCNICNKEMRRSSLPAHLVLHRDREEGSKFPCDKCEKVFLNKRQLNRHQIRHNPDKYKKFPCSHCGKLYYSKYDAKHCEKLHTTKRIPPEKASCPICEKVLACKASVKTHMLFAHTDIRNFSCKVCDMKFKTKGALTAHTRLHTGERPFKCRHCDETFRHEKSRTNHELKHTTGLERPHQCNQCGKSYSTSSGLRQHVLKHTGLKPHLCAECGTGFWSGQKLKMHQRIHTGFKPFKCQFCFASFSRRDNLNRHERTHLGDKRYKCPMCEYRCVDGGNLTKHIRIHKRGGKPKALIERGSRLNSRLGITVPQVETTGLTLPRPNAPVLLNFNGGVQCSESAGPEDLSTRNDHTRQPNCSNLDELASTGSAVTFD